MGKADVPCYKISKAALNAFTVLLSKELPHVLVNSVDPGMSSSSSSFNFISNIHRQSYLPQIAHVAQ